MGLNISLVKKLLREVFHFKDVKDGAGGSSNSKGHEYAISEHYSVTVHYAELLIQTSVDHP